MNLAAKGEDVLVPEIDWRRAKLINRGGSNRRHIAAQEGRDVDVAAKIAFREEKTVVGAGSQGCLLRKGAAVVDRAIGQFIKR